MSDTSLRKRAELAEARAHIEQLRTMLQVVSGWLAPIIANAPDKLSALKDKIDATLSTTPADSAAYLSALEAAHDAAMVLNESMSSARELVDFDNERFASAVRNWREKIAAVEALK